MSNNPGMIYAPMETSLPTDPVSPRRSLVILAAIIFFAEIVSMVVLYFLDLPNYALDTLMDGTIMIALILPALYYLQLKPLMNRMVERDRAEQALRASEKLLRKVLNSLPIGVWILDKQGQIIQGNPVTEEIWAGSRYVGMDQYGEYKGWWSDSGKRIEPEQWAAVRAITRGETILNEEVEIETFDGMGYSNPRYRFSMKGNDPGRSY
jgi:PAS domain-containing protein